MNTFDLSPFFQTKSQAIDFSSRIASVSEKIFETDFHLEKALLSQLGIKKKEAFIALMRNENVAVDSHDELKAFLTKIQQSITSLPVLTLTIAFEPTEHTLKTLSEWFVVNINRQLLFDIQVDPRLIAGAAISFNGQSADFSIRTKFEQIVTDLLKKELEKSAQREKKESN